MLTSVPRRLRPLGVDDKSTVLQEADQTGTAVIIYGMLQGIFHRFFDHETLRRCTLKILSAFLLFHHLPSSVQPITSPNRD
jgi:hypothetical protein